MRATETDLAFSQAYQPHKASGNPISGPLKEAMGPVDWRYAYDVMRYEYGQGWGQRQIGPALGYRQNRVQGKNLYTNWSEFDLLRQVDYARMIDATNPIAQGAVNKLVSFVMQSGPQYKIIAKNKNKKPPESYISDGQDVIDQFREANQWEFEEEEHVRCAIVDGEILGHKGRDEDGEPTIRRPEPEQLQNPPGLTAYDGWRLGVQHELGDACKVLGYNINWKLGLVGSQPFGTFVKADRIIHLKRNVVRSVARGVSDFFSNADDLDKIDRILDAIGAGTIAKSKIPYIRTHENALPGAVTNFAAANATGTFYNPITQRTENEFVPPDGSIVDVPDTVGVVTMPQGCTLESIEAVGLIVRLCIGNRWDMPEHVISGDASNNNMASLMVAGNPFVIAIRRNQTKFIWFWKQCMKWVCTVKMAQGILPLDFLDLCDINIQLPDPVIANEKEAEEIRDIRFRNKILSPQTYSAQAMLNYDDELANKRQALADDPMFAMDQMPQLDANGEPVKQGNASDNKAAKQ